MQSEMLHLLTEQLMDRYVTVMALFVATMLMFMVTLAAVSSRWSAETPDSR